MFSLWKPAERYRGRNLILVVDSEDEHDLEDPRISERVDRLGPLFRFEVKEDGVVVGKYTYRVAYGFRPK